MAASILNVEDFDPAEWKIEREGREWKGEEFDKRIYQAPEKIEYVGGIFVDERQRLTVLAMLLENLGIDKTVQLGNVEDWNAAIAELKFKEHS
ncbi:MAG: hypothetical protein H7Z16_11475 [Pyrinomonadaceae bacterium]|nr:hypothetical protein [Pyrinomonadaceae bacterium]